VALLPGCWLGVPNQLQEAGGASAVTGMVIARHSDAFFAQFVVLVTRLLQYVLHKGQPTLQEIACRIVQPVPTTAMAETLTRPPA
jgi:hypothetical protein